MKICVTGGTGFIGKSLLRALTAAGHTIVVFTRHLPTAAPESSASVHYVLWDGRNGGDWEKEIDGADAVVNLAGEPIAAKRWTKLQKARIIDSRVESTRAIVAAIGRAERKPSILVNGSAVGYYGSVEEGDVDEHAAAGSDFLAETVRQWEEEAGKVTKYGVRDAMLRFGIVLGDNGGALAKMIPPFRFFVGGPLGTGRQWLPWIHIDDVAGIVKYAIDNTALAGPVNAVAPEPVTMRGFSTALGSALGRPSWLPVPGFVLKTLLGEMSGMLLTGQRVVPRKLVQSGYHFKYSQLNQALEHSVR